MERQGCPHMGRLRGQAAEKTAFLNFYDYFWTDADVLQVGQRYPSWPQDGKRITSLSMDKLEREIGDFLEGHGIGYEFRTVCGLTVIVARSHVSGRCRTIVPSGISARSLHEAEIHRKQVTEALASFTEKQDRSGGRDTGPESAITVTEDLWRRCPGMMRSRLLAHLEIFLGLYARNCEIRRIGKPEAASFLKENHSYGDASCRYRYGMYLKRYTGHYLDFIAEDTYLHHPGAGELVAVSEFSNPRTWMKGERKIRSYEWVRYASLAGTRISGGMGKMLEHFIREVHPDDIMSYADLEWSDGAVYRRLGFALEGTRPAVAFEVDGRTWERIPAGRGTVESPLYLINSGSAKYRLKLTEY